MKVLVIGSGISGLATAVRLAMSGKVDKVVLASPYVSERAQSVMAAGGINASLDAEHDSYEIHAQDTLKSAAGLEVESDVLQFCRRAPEMVAFLESLGTVFQRNEDSSLYLRFMGGHTNKRTVCAGALIGKQIVTALNTKCRECEANGLVERKLRVQFHSLLIGDGSCYGALLYNEETQSLETVLADAVVMATGGQNLLFGKTSGSQICDGYATGRIFEQGVRLRDLEFIQYHPTSIETSHKKMLISEAARGEGGRLFYLEGDRRVYFMEDKFGPKGNLKPRDVVSREMFLTGHQVYLDISFLGEKAIHGKLQEIYDLCKTYIGLDICKDPIPVTPTVHFFMGGIAVDGRHETNIRNLYAVGESASKYHGANRLGGNSLMAAVYSGTVAAESIVQRGNVNPEVDFSDFVSEQSSRLEKLQASKSRFPSFYVRQMLSETMNSALGIIRDQETLATGARELEFIAKMVGGLNYDSDVSLYDNYRLPQMILLAKAIIKSAQFRKESRGAHYRSDYPQTDEAFARPTFAEYNDGKITIG